MYKTLSISLTVLAFLGGFLFFYNFKPISDQVSDNSSNQSTSQRWEVKTDEQASVNVTITPLDISIDSREWEFDIIMDTHSVELDQDMIKSAVLVGDDDKEYKPLSWKGPIGGHHREGTLTFTSITPYPQNLTLRIKDIGGVERSFSWILIE